MPLASPLTKRRPRIWLLAVVLGMGLAGNALATHGNPQGKGPRVGVLVSDLRNPFFAYIARAVESTLNQEGRGAAQITVVSSGFDPQRQDEQFKEMIRQRVQLVIVTPVDSTSLHVRVAEARAAGIKVVAVDALVQGADAAVVTDSRAAGKLACEHLVRTLGGKGEVGIIDGPPNTAAVGRVKGCREALGAAPGVRVVPIALGGGATKDGGVEQMTRLLAHHPKLAGVFAINDLCGIGAEMAAQVAGRRDLVITAMDGSPEVVQRLQDPATLIAGSATQSPTLMGQQAAEIGLKLLAGQTPPQRVLLLPSKLVTRENVGGYEGW
ncbi:ABC transporter substrate-binding protein [Variovorax boronicumulans]